MGKTIYSNLKTVKDLLAFAGQPVEQVRNIFDASWVAATICGVERKHFEMGLKTRKETIEALWERVGGDWMAAGMPSHRKSDPMKGEPGWARARYEVLIEQKRTCQICGATPAIRPVEVDHIVPRHLAPDRTLDKTNLRVLCEMCNGGRGGRPHHDDQT